MAKKTIFLFLNSLIVRSVRVDDGARNAYYVE